VRSFGAGLDGTAANGLCHPSCLADQPCRPLLRGHRMYRAMDSGPSAFPLRSVRRVGAAPRCISRGWVADAAKAGRHTNLQRVCVCVGVSVVDELGHDKGVCVVCSRFNRSWLKSARAVVLQILHREVSSSSTQTTAMSQWGRTRPMCYVWPQ